VLRDSSWPTPSQSLRHPNPSVEQPVPPKQPEPPKQPKQPEQPEHVRWPGDIGDAWEDEHGALWICIRRDTWVPARRRAHCASSTQSSMPSSLSLRVSDPDPDLSKTEKSRLLCSAKLKDVIGWADDLKMQLRLAAPAKALIIDLSDEEWSLLQSGDPEIVAAFRKNARGYCPFESNRALARLLYELIDRDTPEGREFISEQAEKPFEERECGRSAFLALVHPRSDDPTLSKKLNSDWEQRNFLPLALCTEVRRCATAVRNIARAYEQIPVEARRLPAGNQGIESIMFHLAKPPFNSQPSASGATLFEKFEGKILKDKVKGKPLLGSGARWVDLKAFSAAVAVEIVLLAARASQAFSMTNEVNPTIAGDDCVVCGTKCGAKESKDCRLKCEDCGLNYCRHTWDKSFPCAIKSGKKPQRSDALNGLKRRIPSFLFDKLVEKWEKKHPDGEATATEETQTSDASTDESNAVEVSWDHL
jgi:hypothetical protein